MPVIFCLSKLKDDKMKKICLKLGLLSCCSLFIVASGGAPTGTSSPTGTSLPVVTSYELFNSTVDATGVLGGTAQQTNNTSNSVKLVTLTGSLKHDTRATSISDGSYTLIDANGADGNNLVTDGSSSLEYVGNFSGSYQYAKVFQQSYKTGGIFYDVKGIVGIAADIPTSTSATYSGEAEAVVLTSSTGFDLKSGKSEVTADFSTGKVSVTLNGFSAVNQETGVADAAPIDEIKISDMAISGNGFSGGSFETSKAGTVVDITGANSSNASQGRFFGKNSDGTAPAEAGGNIFMKGDSGIISAIYLAK